MPTTDLTVANRPPRLSDHGAKVAAGLLRMPVEEYRRHEANGEAWCTNEQRWRPREDFERHGSRKSGVQPQCRACRAEYEAGRRPPYSLTPEGAKAACAPAEAPSGHHPWCHPSNRHLCEGRLPEGWIKAGGAS